MTRYAVPLVAVLVLDAQPWQMGVLGASGSAAVLFLGLSAGVIADRLPRIPLMHGMNLIRLLLVLSIPIAYFAGVLTIAQLAIVVFLLGAATVIFDSCISSVIPVLVERRSLPKANSWMQASVSTSDLFGASVAGGLIQWLGGPVALLLNSVTFVASSLGLPRRGRVELSARSVDDEQKGHLGQVGRGLRIVASDKYLRPMTLAAAHYNFFFSMFFVLLVIFGVRILGLTPGQIGLSIAAAGMGGIVGAAIAVRLARKVGIGRTLLLAYATPGVTVVLIPALPRLPENLVAVGLGALLGVGSLGVVVNIVLSESVKQALVPIALLGRATAYGKSSRG
jgi:MFS family permease